MPEPSLIFFASTVLLLAGAVKGFFGLGMPTVAIAFLTFQLDARSAVALVLVPMLFSNIWQFWRGPDRVHCVKSHWRFAVVLIVFVALSVWMSQTAPDQALRAVLGFLILVFCLFSWRDRVPAIPPHRRTIFEAGSAMIAGLVGGLTAAWAPPLAIYLTGLRLERDAFVQALGFLIAAGSISLFAAYPAVGHVSVQDVALSSFLLLPALIGFTLGERLRAKSDPRNFKSIFLIAFAALGVHLLLAPLLSG